MDKIKKRSELNDYLQKKDIALLKEYHFIENNIEFSDINKGDRIVYIPKVGGLIPVFNSTFQEYQYNVMRIYCYDKKSVMYLSLDTHFIYYKKRPLKINNNKDFRKILMNYMEKLV